MFDYTVEVTKSVEESVYDLEQSLKQEGFGVLWTFDIQEKLNSKGLNFQKKYIVLEVSNPIEAEKVLSKNELAGYFLPCKIVVYESQDHVKIGLPKPTSLITMLADEYLTEVAKDIELRLIQCIDQCK